MAGLTIVTPTVCIVPPLRVDVDVFVEVEVFVDVDVFVDVVVEDEVVVVDVVVDNVEQIARDKQRPGNLRPPAAMRFTSS